MVATEKMRLVALWFLWWLFVSQSQYQQPPNLFSEADLLFLSVSPGIELSDVRTYPTSLHLGPIPAALFVKSLKSICKGNEWRNVAIVCFDDDETFSWACHTIFGNGFLDNQFSQRNIYKPNCNSTVNFATLMASVKRQARSKSLLSETAHRSKEGHRQVDGFMQNSCTDGC